MSSTKALLAGMLGRFIFRAAEVSEVVDVAPSFRRIGFEGAALRGASWQPGDKLQVFLPDVGTRAYTPLHWDAEAGTTALLVYVHGTSPGAAWARALAVGEPAQLFGPRRSLSVPEGRAVIVFGDETSLALVAAIARQSPGRSLVAVLEVNQRAESEAAMRALSVDATLVQRGADDAHLSEVYAALTHALADKPGAQLLMTGRAQAIQPLRARLKRERGVAPATKAYWSLGKAGLD